MHHLMMILAAQARGCWADQGMMFVSLASLWRAGSGGLAC